MTEVRYQIFVSSTFDDLREDRQQAIQSILELGYFPSTMETFPASDETQWQLIKRVISECDYYVVVVGGRYGSIGPSGLSYTEMEYDFALERGIPVLGFVKQDIESLPAKDVDAEPAVVAKLTAFREKVLSRSCRLYRDSAELGMAVMKSLVQETRNNPKTGWVRATAARTEEDMERERTLREELDAAEDQIEKLQRTIRDRQAANVVRGEIAIPCLSDNVGLTIGFREKSKVASARLIFTLEELFAVIAPCMYGYVIKKASPNNYANQLYYKFEPDLEEYIKTREVDKFGSRNIWVQSSELDSLLIAFKEMGLLMYHAVEKDGDSFRGLTLTEAGESELARVSIQRLS